MPLVANAGLGPKSLTFNIFFWAYANANTRSFRLSKNNDLVLVPFWDTSNYGRFANVDTWIYDGNKSLYFPSFIKHFRLNRHKQKIEDLKHFNNSI